MIQKTDNVENQNHGGFLNVNQLKYLAAVFMVLDSAFYAIHGIFPSWIHLITRFVSPLFAFLLVEGFFHTRDRKKYMFRLWTAAILMEAGDILSQFLLGSRNAITDNIFLSLAVGFTVIYLFSAAKECEEAGKRKLLFFSGVVILLAGCVFSVIPIMIGDFMFGLEGGLQVLSVILVFYLFYGNRKKQVIVFLIVNAVFLFMQGSLVLPSADYSSLSIWFDDFCYNSDWMTFLFLPFVFLYNGQKGSKSSFNKYFFYILYPAHLWLLHIIAYCMK